MMNSPAICAQAVLMSLFVVMAVATSETILYLILASERSTKLSLIHFHINMGTHRTKHDNLTRMSQERNGRTDSNLHTREGSTGGYSGETSASLKRNFIQKTRALAGGYLIGHEANPSTEPYRTLPNKPDGAYFVYCL